MSKYNEAIDKVVVTDDMRNRILQNISAEFDENPVEKDVTIESSVNGPAVNAGKVVNFSRTIRKVAAVAAVFIAAVGVSAVLLNNPEKATNSATSLSEMASEPMAITGTESAEAIEEHVQEDGVEYVYPREDLDKDVVKINGIKVTLEHSGGLYYYATWKDDSGEREVANESGLTLEEMKEYVKSIMEK